MTGTGAKVNKSTGTTGDFYNSQWFGVDHEFQQGLEAEAIACTLGWNEPVTD